VAFRRRSYRREALVVYLDEDADGSLLMWKQWSADKLQAAKVDPKRRRDE
jgi:hypothetical protein